MTGFDAIARNVQIVHNGIEQAARRAGRNPKTIRLIAATKFVPVELVRTAIEAGVMDVGESRLQEALPKIESIGQDAVQWHFIGRLQRRKVKSVVGRFALIHSVDSLELAAEIERRAKEAGMQQAVLLEVNLGAEAGKTGFAPAALSGALVALNSMEHVAVKGLMAIPPRVEDPDTARPYFRALRELAVAAAHGARQRMVLDELSMGMSNDYQVAIEEGATMVRVGTAIFGDRPVEVTG
ncbi:MAG TPA: YggS family pyridoxal phosphate-dependent enzyme [Nitrospiraceae bacterium]|nr:YggS family pyridoxal phosphate-dependent enzyme [Nitrospiraceae bacterium]